jgi:prepilin-type N-terminal cleavage/methylation domain-containing protein
MRKKSAFTLVELMVAMAIISVLLGLAVFGVSAAQRGSRNTERKAALQDINLAIQVYVDKFSNVPTTILFDNGSSAAYIGGTTLNCEQQGLCVKVPLKGPAKPSGAISGISTPLTNGNSDMSQYIYSSTCTGASGGYRLGVCVEGNTKAFSVGTCTDDLPLCP